MVPGFSCSTSIHSNHSTMAPRANLMDKSQNYFKSKQTNLNTSFTAKFYPDLSISRPFRTHCFRPLKSRFTFVTARNIPSGYEFLLTFSYSYALRQAHAHQHTLIHEKASRHSTKVLSYSLSQVEFLIAPIFLRTLFLFLMNLPGHGFYYKFAD